MATVAKLFDLLMVVHPQGWSELIRSSEADSTPEGSRPRNSDDSSTEDMESCSASTSQNQCTENHAAGRWKGRQVGVR